MPLPIRNGGIAPSRAAHSPSSSDSAPPALQFLRSAARHPDAETLHLAREELFSYTRLIFDNPPTTLAKTIQLTSMLKKMLDEANNLHVIDFDFTPGLGSLDPSLKRKKSFFSPTKKRRSNRKNSGLETDLNVDPSEYEPFESRYLNKRGRHRSNNVVSMVPAMQQSPTVAITQDQREMQDHPTLPAMPGNYRISGEVSSSTMTDHLWKDFNSSGNQ